MGIVIIGRREDNPDVLVGRKDEGILSNVEVCRCSCTGENFLESWGLGWEVRDAVDVPLSLSGGLQRFRALSTKSMK
jgi:hypothetical protein